MIYRDERVGIRYTRNLFLRSICAVYLVAFISFYYQCDGLYGNSGLAPVTASQYQSRPNLLHLSTWIGLDHATMLELLAVVGTLVAFLGFVSRHLITLPLMAVLWIIYYSLAEVMGPFKNQADLLLLEAGALCVLLAPTTNIRKQSVTDRMALLMIRWLLFRFLFQSGAVKLASQCPHWWRLDGLQRHLETMPLPTPLTWYAYQVVPEHWLKMTMVYVNVGEFIVSFLCLAPQLALRKIAFYWHLILQLFIIASGNYGHLNFLVVALLFAVLDDAFFLPNERKKEKQSGGWMWVAFVLSVIGYGTWYYYGIGWSNGQFTFNLRFDQDQYDAFLNMAIRLVPVAILIGIIYTFLNEMVKNVSIRNASSRWMKVFRIVKAALFQMCCLAILSASVVPWRSMTLATDVESTDLGQIYKQIQPYMIVNGYGKHLIKMRSERLEIVFEQTSADLNDETDVAPVWKEYSFAYKPDGRNQSLAFAGPYFPRLDFTLWEAAPSNIDKHKWVSAVVFRLLQGEKTVVKLLGPQPAGLKRKPKYVRAMLYKLKYTKGADKPGGYWERKPLAEYLPPQKLTDALLESHLKAVGVSRSNYSPLVRNQVVKNALKWIRNMVCTLEGSTATFATLCSGFAVLHAM